MVALRGDLGGEDKEALASAAAAAAARTCALDNGGEAGTGCVMGEDGALLFTISDAWNI